MTFWTLDNIRSVLGGTWGALPARGAPAATGVSTDSRSVRAGEVFFAIAGERTDGHLFLPQAARAGASLAVIGAGHTGPTPAGLPLLRVFDTTKALLRLAAAYRKTLEGTRVVVVTGSNGKTTTKQMIHAVLSATLRGSASVKSFNNHVGVPLTIFGARPGDQYLVCEVGTNAPGEVAELARAASPDVSVITSIGREHLEKLGSLRRVAQEESSQIEFLRPGGLAVVHGEAPHLREMVEARAGEPHRISVVTFGTKREADLRVGGVRQDTSGTSFTINERHAYRIPLLGAHNALNAAAAVAVARRFGVDHEAIAAGLASVQGAEMRLQGMMVSGVRIINDAYNANPDSMAAALETFAHIGDRGGAGRRIAVLGDMLELGEHTASAHAEVVARSLDQGIGLDRLVLVGPHMARAAGGVRDERLVIVEDPGDGPVGAIAGLLRAGDAVLLKGSRRMRLERVVEGLRGPALEGPPREIKPARPARGRRARGAARPARRRR